MGPVVSAGEPSDQSGPSLSESWSSRASDVRVEEQGTTVLLRLSGAFDRACVGRVEAALQRLSAAHTRRVVFDLKGLRFLDSTGLTAILKAHERARTEPFEVLVVRPRGLASRVFTLTGAGAQLKMVDQIPRTNGTA
jgi:anti-anti-sigma factor